LLKISTEWVINCYILSHFKFPTIKNTIVEVGAVEAASRYSSGSGQMMQLRLRPNDEAPCGSGSIFATLKITLFKNAFRYVTVQYDSKNITDDKFLYEGILFLSTSRENIRFVKIAGKSHKYNLFASGWKEGAEGKPILAQGSSRRKVRERRKLLLLLSSKGIVS
jgi:hypothetical protein